MHENQAYLFNWAWRVTRVDPNPTFLNSDQIFLTLVLQVELCMTNAGQTLPTLKTIATDLFLGDIEMMIKVKLNQIYVSFHWILSH